MGDIRTFTDNFIFGNDPSQRNIVQAAGRDVSHGVFHIGEAIIDCLKFDFDAAGHNLSRAAAHLSGENVKQIDSNNSEGSEYSGDYDYYGDSD